MKNILNKIRIDNTTYILILLSLLSGYIKNSFIILLIVLVHELGHVFFFWLFNIDIDSIVIYPFGGVSRVNKRIHERIYKDVLISLGGIIFQILLGIIFYFLYSLGFIVTSTYEMFWLYSLSIIAFNLLPIIPLDGSKLLFCLLSKFISYRKCLIIQVLLGSISMILFILFVINRGLNDVIIVIFLAFELWKCIKEYKYVLNRFYLERILYDNYYDGIYSDKRLEDMKLNKYYFFKEGTKYINEKKYLLKNKF